MNDTIQKQCFGVLGNVLDTGQLTWLANAVSELDTDANQLEMLTDRFPTTRRKLGKRAVSDDASIRVGDQNLPVAGWEANELGRAALLVTAAQHACAAEFLPVLFRAGDETERTAIVKSLMLFVDGESLKPVALEAGRGNSAALFAALALDNPYPAAHYTEQEFNQLVLKTLFMGLPIGRIVDLETRVNPDLSRMCEDFYDERTAAQRLPPLDIWLAMIPHASQRGLELAKTHLEDDEPGHRFHAALALGRRAGEDPELKGLLQDRLQSETDQRVLSALHLAN